MAPKINDFAGSKMAQFWQEKHHKRVIHILTELL